MISKCVTYHTHMYVLYEYHIPEFISNVMSLNII